MSQTQQSINIDTHIEVKHIIYQGLYLRTKISVEVKGSLTMNDKELYFEPETYSVNIYPHDYSKYLGEIAEKIAIMRQKMVEKINRFLQMKDAIIASLKDQGVVVEKFVED